VVDRVELFRALLPGSHDRPRSTLTTREQLQRFWYDLAGTAFPAPAKALVDVVGPEHVLYGSDFCWTPAMGASHQVTLMEQQSIDWRALTTANAQRLLA
jgi:predicted TIM-barrel fold metal-dependent hydrolase